MNLSYSITDRSARAASFWKQSRTCTQKRQHKKKKPGDRIDIRKVPLNWHRFWRRVSIRHNEGQNIGPHFILKRNTLAILFQNGLFKAKQWKRTNVMKWKNDGIIFTMVSSATHRVTTIAEWEGTNAWFAKLSLHKHALAYKGEWW